LFIFFNVKESNDQGRSRECRFGSKCSRADCYFSHPTGWSANDVRKRQMEESQQMCRFGSDCHRKTCHYNHPPDRNMKMESYHRERELEKKKMKLEVERNQREHLRNVHIVGDQNKSYVTMSIYINAVASVKNVKRIQSLKSGQLELRKLLNETILFSRSNNTKVYQLQFINYL